MTTSSMLRRRPRALVLAALLAPVTGAQVDPGWLRMWRAAQRHRPSALDSVGRLAPPGEPGVTLIVDGQVLEPDGTTPAAGTIVFAYQTDHEGIYFGPDRPGAPWRLQGWARTGGDGRFRLLTVRPGPYPGRAGPAHIHITLESPVHGRQWTPSLLFADDPLVSPERRASASAAGRFGHVCEVQMEDGVAHVQILLRLNGVSDF